MVVEVDGAAALIAVGDAVAESAAASSAAGGRMRTSAVNNESRI
jgi:hypothetical protein